MAATTFLAVAGTPTAAAIPDVPCDAVPDEVRRSCVTVNQSIDGAQRIACIRAVHYTYQVAGEDAADVVYRTCNGI